RRLHLGHEAVELPPKFPHALDGHAEAAGEEVEAAPHGGLDRLWALRGHPDGRVRTLEGLRKDRGLRDLEELALVREGLAGERLQDDVDRFLPARPRAVQFEPQALELVVLVAA